MSADKYADLEKENAQLYRQLAVYQQKSPLVGVRFYGYGGFGIGLNQNINGLTRVSLQGYGDKGIIDQAAWQRIKGTEEVQAGIVVRDDSVIEEFGVEGVVAEPERIVNNNAFTDKEIINHFEKTPIKQLKKIAENITHHFSAKHWVEVAKMNKINDKAKTSIFEDRHFKLFTIFKWSLLNVHDLRLACEIQNIRDFDRMTVEQMIEVLTELELKNLREEE